MCQSGGFQEKYDHTGKGSHLISSNALLGEACGNAQDSLFIISCTAVFPNLGVEPRSPILQAESLPSEPPGKPPFLTVIPNWYYQAQRPMFQQNFPIQSQMTLFLFYNEKKKTGVLLLSLLT